MNTPANTPDREPHNSADPAAVHATAEAGPPADSPASAPTPQQPQPDAAEVSRRLDAIAARLTLGVMLLDRARRELRRLVRDHKPICPRRGKKVRRCAWCEYGHPACDVCEAWSVLRRFMTDDTTADVLPAPEAADRLSSFTCLSDRRDKVRELEDILDRIARAH